MVQKITICTEQNKVLSSDHSACIESWIFACLSMTQLLQGGDRRIRDLLVLSPAENSKLHVQWDFLFLRNQRDRNKLGHLISSDLEGMYVLMCDHTYVDPEHIHMKKESKRKLPK